MKILARAEWSATAAAPKPDVSFIPAMERRRLTSVEKAALSVAHQALSLAFPSTALDPKLTTPTNPQPPSSPNTPTPQHPNTVSTIPIVFASRWGEIGTTLKLMRQMHEEGEMSPAGFSNSVHNAAPGHLSLFLKNKAPYTAVAAGPDSYEMGLLEAKTTPGKVLFIYAEEETPEFYRGEFKDIQSAHAVAMVIDNDAEDEA